jgi:hypothetical protein
LRQDLDVYIHFVKDVSTLSPTQLDTPDPTPRVRPIVGVVAPPANVVASSPARPTPFGAVDPVTRLPLRRG